MELRQLKTFQMTAKLLSFHRAAETLNYAPSTVSTQIKLLEEELGTPLFDRLGKRIRLTSAGQMLVHYSRRMLDIEKETLSKVSNWQEPHGTISIRMPQSIATYLLPKALSKFQDRFPKIGFDVSTCAYDVLIHELKTGMTDVAFLLAESIPFAELASEVLRVETLTIICSPEHRLARRPKFQIRDLAGHTILLPKHDCSYKMVFENLLLEEKIENTPFMELNSVEAIKHCVLNGIGVAMLPRMAIELELEQEKLSDLLYPEDRFETAILMIWHRRKWLSPALRSFMDTIREVLTPQLHKKDGKKAKWPCQH